MSVLMPPSLQGWGKDHFGPDASYQVLTSGLQVQVLVT